MKIDIKNQRIVVVGLGYVGLPLALLAAEKGYPVIGIDISKEKVDTINKKEVPFVDKNIVEKIKNTNMVATTDFSAINDATIVVICVPTPVHKDHKPDLTPVINSCQEVAKHVNKGQLVILESTVNPGVSEDTVLPILESGSRLKCGVDFHLAHCPERINPGDEKYDVSNISRVVGSTSKQGLDMSMQFYTSIISAPIRPMNTIKEAEAVKIVENCFRDVNIAFVNELAMSFSKLGIDIVNVIEGASTKPYSFMPHFPGCGVGGHCIAVDPYYLIEYAHSSVGFDHKLLSLSREINNSMPRFTVHLLETELNKLNIPVSKAKVLVLGLAYKANIDDCRESPAFEIIEELEKIGIKPDIYDPFVLDKSTTKTLEDALKDKDMVVIATGHDLFRKISAEDFSKAGIKAIVDGRNCLERDAIVSCGINYVGIGR